MLRYELAAEFKTPASDERATPRRLVVNIALLRHVFEQIEIAVSNY